MNWSKISSMSFQWSKKKKVSYGVFNSGRLTLRTSWRWKHVFLQNSRFCRHQLHPQRRVKLCRHKWFAAINSLWSARWPHCPCSTKDAGPGLQMLLAFSFPCLCFIPSLGVLLTLKPRIVYFSWEQQTYVLFSSFLYLFIRVLVSVRFK